MLRQFTVVFFIFVSVVCAFCQTTDLLAPLASNNPAYGQLRELARFGIISTADNSAFRENSVKPLTRYDVAFLLLDPLELCSLLVEMQENPKLLADNRQRVETIYRALARLTDTELQQALKHLSQLLESSSEDIGQLMPGLAQRAAPALKKLTLPNYHPWTIREPGDSAASSSSFHVSLNPRVESNSFTSPLTFIGAAAGTDTSPAFVRSTTDTGAASNPLLLTRSVTSLEAAVDMALGRVRLYGSVGPLPGTDLTMTLLRSDGTGKAMVGVEVDILQINNLDISGIFEYHIMRYGDPAARELDSGAVGGIGIRW